MGAFTKVDVTDLVIATGVGAATGGLNSLSGSFTKATITEGILTVVAIGEAWKATVDVNLDILTAEVETNSITDGTKSPFKAAVQFPRGNLPGSGVSEEGESPMINAATEYFTESLKGVLEEGINVQVDDEHYKKDK